MGKIKQWIVSHKVWSIVIASVLVVGIALSIALPLTLKKCDHEYDHACDPTCNICGETREISYYTTSEDNDFSWVFLGDEMIEGVAGGQYVFKIVNDFSPMGLSTDRTDIDAPYISLDKYAVKFFDKDFNEINVRVITSADTLVVYTPTNESGEVISVEGEYLYMMVTLNEAVTFCPFAQ